MADAVGRTSRYGFFLVQATDPSKIDRFRASLDTLPADGALSTRTAALIRPGVITTALHHAAEAGNVEAVRAYVEKFPKDAVEKCGHHQGWSPMHIAALKGDMESFSIMVDATVTAGVPLARLDATLQNIFVQPSLRLEADATKRADIQATYDACPARRAAELAAMPPLLRAIETGDNETALRLAYEQPHMLEQRYKGKRLMHYAAEKADKANDWGLFEVLLVKAEFNVAGYPITKHKLGLAEFREGFSGMCTAELNATETIRGLRRHTEQLHGAIRVAVARPRNPQEELNVTAAREQAIELATQHPETLTYHIGGRGGSAITASSGVPGLFRDLNIARLHHCIRSGYDQTAKQIIEDPWLTRALRTNTTVLLLPSVNNPATGGRDNALTLMARNAADNGLSVHFKPFMKKATRYVEAVQQQAKRTPQLAERAQNLTRVLRQTREIASELSADARTTISELSAEARVIKALRVAEKAYSVAFAATRGDMHAPLPKKVAAPMATITEEAEELTTERDSAAAGGRVSAAAPDRGRSVAASRAGSEAERGSAAATAGMTAAASRGEGVIRVRRSAGETPGLAALVAQAQRQGPRVAGSGDRPAHTLSHASAGVARNSRLRIDVAAAARRALSKDAGTSAKGAGVRR